MQIRDPNLHVKLKALIDDEGNKEEECKKFLRHVRDLLVTVTSAEFVDEAEEYRGHSGDSDYLIVCSAIEDSGIQTNFAYIWEAKAPQTYIFEQDTKNRVKPTKEFVSAENQLLHYYEEYKGSDQFKEEFGITHPDNVKLGGIIIGCEKMLVKSREFDDHRRRKLYARAINLRSRVLYGHSGIDVLTWDRILKYLTPEPAPDPRSEGLTEPLSTDRREYTIVNSGSN